MKHVLKVKGLITKQDKYGILNYRIKINNHWVNQTPCDSSRIIFFYKGWVIKVDDPHGDFSQSLQEKVKWDDINRLKNKTLQKYLVPVVHSGVIAYTVDYESKLVYYTIQPMIARDNRGYFSEKDKNLVTEVCDYYRIKDVNLYDRLDYPYLSDSNTLYDKHKGIPRIVDYGM